MTQTCPLCTTQAPIFYKNEVRYYRCLNCFGIFKDSRDVIALDDEKIRYELHNNDAEDEGYIKFVSPITSNVLDDFTSSHDGLDFGAGVSAIVSKVLQKSDYSIAEYDPFFHNHPTLLNHRYDYITSCEVIEHFCHPKKEFQLLRRLLKDNSKLYCMSELYKEDMDFENWYYKNDPTHIFFYSEKTLNHIKKAFGFSDVFIENRLIVFTSSLK